MKRLALAAFALALSTTLATAQTNSIRVRSGVPVWPPNPGGATVHHVVDVRVNAQGDLLTRVLGFPSGFFVMWNDVVVAAVNDWVTPVHTPGAPRYTQLFDLALDDGQTAWSCAFERAPGVQYQGVVRNGVLVLQSGTETRAPQYSSRKIYRSVRLVGAYGGDALVVFAGLSDPSSTVTTPNALVRWTFAPNGGLASEDVIAKFGDTRPGVPGALAAITPRGVDPNGVVLYQAQFGSSPSADAYLMRDQETVLQYGQAAYTTGFPWVTIECGAHNARGDHVLYGRQTPFVDRLCRNTREILATRGDVVPTAAIATLSDVSSIAMDLDGNFVWRAALSTQIGDDAVFRNDELLVQRDVTQFEGSVVVSIDSAPAISSDARYIAVGVKLANYLRGALVFDMRGTAPGIVSFCAGDGSFIDHTTPCPCGNSGAPGNGCAHSADPRGAFLTTRGAPATDDIVLHGEHTPATAYAMFLQHSSPGETVFHDGVLCASGTLVRLRGRAAIAGSVVFPDTRFAQDSTTTLSLRGGVVAGSGAVRYYSAWYRNTSSTFCPPTRANVTNGIRVTW